MINSYLFIMSFIFLLFSIVYFLLGTTFIHSKKELNPSLLCGSKVHESTCSDKEICSHKFSRIIVIGDVHGSYVGLLDDLFHANITISKEKCEWKTQLTSTLLVQMGDLVDRGPGALESIKCMQHLQETSNNYNSEVVRLLGNHELFWLNGYFRDRNKVQDTSEKIQESLRIMINDILSKKIIGAYLLPINNVPVVFVHAGFSSAFMTYMQKQNVKTPQEIVDYTNGILHHKINTCSHFPCKLPDELFEAGPERGGKGIGGPFWTDFGILEDEAYLGTNPRSFVQIVGHTMAHCYHPSRPNIHPTLDVLECSLGLVRASDDFNNICVDGGMYCGARAFLEINVNNHFLIHERRGDEENTPWTMSDMTLKFCKE